MFVYLRKISYHIFMNTSSSLSIVIKVGRWEDEEEVEERASEQARQTNADDQI